MFFVTKLCKVMPRKLSEFTVVITEYFCRRLDFKSCQWNSLVRQTPRGFSVLTDVLMMTVLLIFPLPMNL
jgi:hypothetical protein